MNYGFEIELFGTKGKKVFNAEKLIKNKILKDFRLDLLSKFDRGTSDQNVLLKGYPFNLISDGTAFEIVGTKTACEPSMLGGEAAKEINYNLCLVRNYLSALFKIDTSTLPYVSKSDGWEFVEPGSVFCSEKKNHNAYTNKWWYGKKKESGEDVTFRSAGFHIHIRFDTPVANKMFEGMYCPPLCNELIIELDKVYNQYFPNCLVSKNLIKQENLRNEKFAKLGTYRIKYHPQNFSTLEYRQFSSAFFLLGLDAQKQILHDFASTVRKFTNKLK